VQTIKLIVNSGDEKNFAISNTKSDLVYWVVNRGIDYGKDQEPEKPRMKPAYVPRVLSDLNKPRDARL